MDFQVVFGGFYEEVDFSVANDCLNTAGFERILDKEMRKVNVDGSNNTYVYSSNTYYANSNVISVLEH